MESGELCRNPPPPLELLEDSDALVPDKIGETVFSKHWLFQSLLNIMEAVEKEKENVEPLPSDSAALRNGNRDRVLELDPEVEEKVCTLWDMSSDKDVAYFLLENRAVDIFMDAIQKTIAPRLVETLVGIMGNMAFFSNICEHITKTPRLTELIVQLIGSSDAPTLIQVVRLIHVCVVNETSSSAWIEAISKNNQFLSSLKFILKNSLNGDLLKSSLQMLYCILDKYQQMHLEWNRHEIVEGVIEAGKQLKSLGDYKGLDEYWYTLQFLFQQDDGTIKIDESFDSVSDIFHQYILKQSDNDTCLPKLKNITGVAAAVSVFHVIITNGINVKYQDVIADHTFLHNIEEIFASVRKAIDRQEVSNKTHNSADDEIMSISNPVQMEEEQSQSNEAPTADLAHLYILHDEIKELCEVMFSCEVKPT